MKNTIICTIVQHTKSQTIFISCPKLSECFLQINVHMLLMHLEKTLFCFSFRWMKGARNFHSMSFENLPSLEELFGEMIDKTILEIYQLFLTKMWNSYLYNSLKDMPIKKPA